MLIRYKNLVYAISGNITYVIEADGKLFLSYKGTEADAAEEAKTLKGTLLRTSDIKL